MAITKQEVNPTLIPNTTMLLGSINGVPMVYEITPVDGYVLHDNARDWSLRDEVTGEEVLTRGYTAGMASCGAASYDFSAVTMIDGYVAHGSREFFARPANEVPEDQIFGGGDNNHEVM